MTPNDIAELAAAATEREVEKMKSNPIVKKIVADLESQIVELTNQNADFLGDIKNLTAENESLKAEVAELKARLAEPPKKRAAK